LYHQHGIDEEEHQFVWPQRTVVEIDQMLHEACVRADDLNAAAYEDGQDDAPLEDFGCTEGLDPNVEDFANLL